MLLTVGLMGSITAFAYFLHEFGQLSMWVSWGITSGIFIALGIALAATSYVLLERFNPLPSKTLHALQREFKNGKPNNCRLLRSRKRPEQIEAEMFRRLSENR